MILKEVQGGHRFMFRNEEWIKILTSNGFHAVNMKTGIVKEFDGCENVLLIKEHGPIVETQEVNGEHVANGQTIMVLQQVNTFTVRVNSINTVAASTIKDLIEKKFEVLSCDHDSRTLITKSLSSKY